MIADGFDPEKIATMNNGGACGITGLDDAGNVSCSGIRGLSIGVGILFGSSTVTNVKWKSCK